MKSWALACASLLVLGAACARNAAPQRGTELPRLPKAVAKPAEPAPRSLRAAELAEVPSVTYGPYLGVRPDGAVVVWASISGGKRRFQVVPLTPDGRPRGEPRAVADAPDQLGLVVIRPFGAGHALVYSERVKGDEKVHALCLDASGTPTGPANLLGSVSGQALWLEAVPTTTGALLFAASRGGGAKRSAEIAVIALGNGCKGSAPTTVAKEALSWQAAALSNGALLATVRAAPGAISGLGSVEAVLLDGSGAERQKLTIAKEPSAELDLDAVSLGDRVVVGFSDQRGLEPRVVTAVIDDKGALVEAPSPLTPAGGEQTLVRLVAGEKAAFAAWENLRSGPGSLRHLQLSALDRNGKLSGPRAELDYVSTDAAVPELAAGARGLSALAIAPVCPRSGPCNQPSNAPFYVEFDPQLNPVAAEPLRLEPLNGRRAEIGFGLGCSGQHCYALAALARAPAPVFATQLEARSNAWRAPARRLDGGERPRVIEEQALTLTDSVAAFSLATQNGQSFVAHVTDFDSNVPWKPLLRPAADGRFDPLRAKVVVERPAQGLEKPAPLAASPISLRAHSLGGVTLAPAPDGKLLLAWAGVDQAEPQVFLTLLGKDGKREVQRMMTRKKGALGEIAVTWVGDGWVLGWIDSRSGNATAYAAKIDPRLNRASREYQLSSTEGTASELVFGNDGKSLYAVFADARGNDALGRADVYARRLNPHDAAPVGDEVRLSATREHSFSPAIAAFGGRFAVAWLDRGAQDGAPGKVSFRILDDQPHEAVSRVIDAGDAGALGIACAATECRLALTLELEAERQALLGVARADETGITEVARVLDLGGSRGLGVPPTIEGDTVSFVSADNDGAAVRRAKIIW